MSSLIQAVMGAVTPDLTSRLGGILGESPGKTRQGLEGAAAALLVGATQQASTASGASHLLDLVTQATSGGNPLDQAGEAMLDRDPQAGALPHERSLADGLLGGNLGSIASQLASSLGLSAKSASSLLAMAAPFVLGALGRLLGPNPTAGGLQSLLAGQRSDILSAVPDGVRSLLGTGTAAVGATAAAASSGFSRILPWLLIGIVILALLFALRTCMKKEPVADVSLNRAVPAAAPTPAETVFNLPGGTSISLRENTIAYNVIRFLESSEPAPKTFVFDNLNFDTASNALTPESKPTADALAKILAAYPSVTARVVGYTDNQGDPAANKTLSDARATTVKNELVSRGIDAARIEKAGMGEANPVADNATEEGRAANRRTELQITKK